MAQVDVMVVDNDSVNNNIEERDELEQLVEECEKHAYSDGKYYIIDTEKSSLRVLVGVCQLCLHHQTIRGSFKAPSNFTTHIKVYLRITVLVRS